MKKVVTICIKKNEKNRRISMWRVFCQIVVLAFLLSGYVAQAAQTFDVAADFSTTNNPNGAWSYGWSSTLTSALNQYPDHDKMGERAGTPINIDAWSDWEQFSSYSPNATHNGTGTINNEHWTITWQPGQFSLHPGDNGVYSHARWTAPSAGIVDIAAMFTGIDHYYGTTTDVHILHNGNSLFDGLVNGYGNTSSFSTTTSIDVGLGDTIDFAVGYGSNNNPTCDTTALSATISFIPEPAIAATVDIQPDTLNLQSKGKWITCHIAFPTGANVADVNSSTILLNGQVKAEWTWVDEETQVMMVKFSRSAVQAILQPGTVELTVSGKLNDGTRFEGKDTITVINEGKP
jgi:hypothetical protein